MQIRDWLGYIRFTFEEGKPRASLDALIETFGKGEPPPPPDDATHAMLAAWHEELDMLSAIACDERDDNAIARAREWVT